MKKDNTYKYIIIFLIVFSVYGICRFFEDYSEKKDVSGDINQSETIYSSIDGNIIRSSSEAQAKKNNEVTKDKETIIKEANSFFREGYELIDYDVIAAVENFKKACELKHDRGCVFLGDYLSIAEKQGLTYEPIENIIKFLFDECNLNNAGACGAIGVIKRQHLKVTSNPKELNEIENYLLKSCDLNSSNGCLKLAYHYENTLKKPKEAIKYFYKSCNLEDANPLSCEKLGDYHNDLAIDNKGSIDLKPYRDKGMSDSEILDEFWSNESVRKKLPSLDLLREMAGKSNVNDSRILNSLNEMGSFNSVAQKSPRVLPLDYKKAREFYTKACNLNAVQACLKLAILYNKGRGGTRDKLEAESLAYKVCNQYGEQKGCELYEDMRKRGY